MFGLILYASLFILSFVTLFRVAKYGRNLLFPDFERVDRIFAEKHGASTRWDSTLGRIAYYLWLFLTLFFLSLIVLMII